MKMLLSIIRPKGIFVLAIAGIVSFSFGYFTACNVNKVCKHTMTVKGISTKVHFVDDMDTTNNIEIVHDNEDDPLIHLKLLQEDVKTFKALMEDVKNELFAADNA
jgi:alpha/beta superfamily hydrolase